jgi:VanZ family protein
MSLSWKSWKRQLAVVNLVYAVVLLGLGILPALPGVGVSDHTAHALAYGIQAGLLYLFLLPSLSRGRAALVAASGAIVYSSLIEGLQFLQPSRTFEIIDLAANVAGAVLTVLIAYLLTRQARVETEG